MATAVTMSGQMFDALPYDDGRRWELLEGDLIEVSSPTPQHRDIVFNVLSALRHFLAAGQGRAYGDVEFALSDQLRLRPDVAVLLGEKARILDRTKVPIPGAPDLAIEVISPTERASESHDKVLAYLRNGTSEVWQLYPKSQTLEIHRHATAISLHAAQNVASETLPGFNVPVASFFE